MNITFGGNEVHLYGKQLKVGDQFPEFTVTNTELNDVESIDLKGPKVFLAFPSVDTSVCSLELLTFNDRLEDKKDLNVYGISLDLPFAQKRWVELNAGDYIKMYSDHKYGTFGKVTGTYVEELAILARASFVVDKDNVITYAEYLPEIGHEPDYDKILEEANKLK